MMIMGINGLAPAYLRCNIYFHVPVLVYLLMFPTFGGTDDAFIQSGNHSLVFEAACLFVKRNS